MNRTLQLLFYIPLATLGYFTFLLVVGFINTIFMTNNYLMENYIVPIIANAIGVMIYFKIGLGLLPQFKKSIYKKSAIFLLAMSFLAILTYFLYYCYLGGEYYKLIVNFINIAISVLVLISLLHDEKNLD